MGGGRQRSVEPLLAQKCELGRVGERPPPVMRLMGRASKRCRTRRNSHGLGDRPGRRAGRRIRHTARASAEARLTPFCAPRGAMKERNGAFPADSR
ncbi:hypothetical protein C791_5318 [Amycolatopsis azurea DSM 43854]|uniref:Uncharacterized protein n=1 Tax=Amycolatopsis azurea DSM 43854 TaxID=1238180 RepID=M2NRN5_9PSEU|nr:hypothetical protein C791_5318 [Amycolatopsis azurea DSM 43854]